MGAETPAAGGETKPVVKHEGRPPYHGGRNNANKNNNYNHNAQEKFLGADANLRGKYLKPSALDQSKLLTSKLSTTYLRRRWGVSTILLS